MSTRLVSPDVFAMQLDSNSTPGAWVEGGWPVARTQRLASVRDTTLAVWEVTTGVVADIENDECFVVLSGSGQVHFEGGQTHDLKPGVFLQFCAGDRTEWTVRNTIRALIVG